MPVITPQLESQAQQLANDLRFSPEGRQRVTHTEKMWRYRSYQGGDPVGSIDWRQSARSRDILVRDHEKIVMRDIFFGLFFDPEQPRQTQTLLLLLALAHTLVKKERAVGWISPLRPLTRTSSLVGQLFEDGFRDKPLCLASQDIRNQFILIAGDMDSGNQPLHNLVKTYMAQGNRGLLIPTQSPDARTDDGLLKAALNAQWPVVSMDDKKGNNRLDFHLAHLLEKTLQATR